MTLIVYRNGELVADRLVVHKSNIAGLNKFREVPEGKLRITPENDIAYVFDNDQIERILEPVLVYIRRYESGQLSEDDPRIEFDQDLRLVLMTRRSFYTVAHENNYLTFRDAPHDVYISPNGSYRFYDALKLTAEEIYKTMVFVDNFMVTTDYEKISAKSLTLIRKKR